MYIKLVQQYLICTKPQSYFCDCIFWSLDIIELVQF